jgi:hypothetical protein
LERAKSQHKRNQDLELRQSNAVNFSQNAKNRKVYSSGKPTPEPKYYLIKDKYDLHSKAETKSFDNAGGMLSKKHTSSSINLTSKVRKSSKSRKRDKNVVKGMKKMESPYSSHPKSDHIRSKSSYIKGPKAFKSIFKVYREAGVTGKSIKDMKNK